MRPPSRSRPVGKKRSAKTRRRSADPHRPFNDAVLKRARAIARKYRIILKPDPDLGWIGNSVEMPNVYADGRTPDACVRQTVEALTTAVATMLELGQAPPEASERKTQVNIRLTAEEKLLIASRAVQRGFRGISDYVRAAALNWS